MAAVPATDATIQKKVFGSKHSLDLEKRTTLKFLSEEIDYILKTVKSLKDASLLIKCVSKQNAIFKIMLDVT